MDVLVVPRFAESAFITQYREDARHAADKQQKARAKRRAEDKEKRDELLEAGVYPHWFDKQEAQRWIDARRFERDLDLERINNGYVRVGGAHKISGHELRNRVSEKGLRSRTTGNQFMELFPSYLPKRGLIRGNWGKSVLLTQTSKVRALDLPYVEGRRDCLGFFRWDTDFVWPSVGAARAAFLTLRDKGIPIPHVLTGLVLPTGEFVRPHALRGLPYGSGVMADPNRKGFRKAALAFYHDVYLGMCEAMLEVGCDPSAPAATMQTKNPLSPELCTVVLQDDDWRSLTEIGRDLKKRLRRDVLIRQAAAVQSGLEIKASNEIFETYRRAALECLRTWMWSGDPAYVDAMSSPDRGALQYYVHQHLESISVSAEIDTDLTAVRGKVAQYAVDNWDPSKSSSKRKGEGALLHVVASMTKKESQAAGARYSAEQKKRVAMEKISAALESFHRAGDQPPSVRKLAKAAGVSPDTVQSRRDEVAELVSLLWVSGVRNQSKDKKDRFYPVDREEEAETVLKLPSPATMAVVVVGVASLGHVPPGLGLAVVGDDDALPLPRCASEFTFDPDADTSEE
ncbi:hypothetical protein [Rhizobium leguminosarum]|uniref:hypothetical protein n=1 Tax=Rhizobium leguminosarum TaxID=384 RepID=UPI003F94B530